MTAEVLNTVDDALVIKMRGRMQALAAAIESGEVRSVYEFYKDLETEFWVDGPHAAAMLLYDELRTKSNMLRRLNAESTRFAEAYLDEKRRAAEWKEITEDQAEMIARLKESVRKLGGTPG